MFKFYVYFVGSKCGTVIEAKSMSWAKSEFMKRFGGRITYVRATRKIPEMAK